MNWEGSMKVGVLGAGVMGAGIAQVTATAGYETVCYDVDADALTRGEEHVTTGRYGFERGVERGKFDARGRRRGAGAPSFTASFDEAASVDVVSRRCPRSSSSSSRCSATSTPPRPRRTILASNTSGFPIGQIAAGDQRDPSS